MNANRNSDLHSLLLKKSPFKGVSMLEIVQQIKGKKGAQKKFPFLLKNGIIFPPQLNLEQASSQSTAAFKAKNLTGKTFLDLTTGFGIDAFFLSKNFENITLIEQNTELLNIVSNNWTILGRAANFINKELRAFLKENTAKFDLIYLDPARRDHQKNKKFLLEDLSPNILEIQNILMEIGTLIIIKLSPLIDLSYLLSTIKNIKKIEILAVKNEVKELLIYISSQNFSGDTEVFCTNLESEDADFSFIYKEEKDKISEFSKPLQFIYIPNNAVLKSGGFNSLATEYQLQKLHPNSHFYTSNMKLSTFPGRILQAELINDKQLKKGEKYNIISKNYPLKPEEIKKKYKILDGGTIYLLCTQSISGKVILKGNLI